MTTIPLGDLDVGRIDAIRRMPAGEAQAAVAKEVQAVFLTQLLAALRRTVPESDFLPRAPAHTVYEGLFDRAVAEAMAERDPLALVERFRDGFKLRDDRADRATGNRHEATARGLGHEDR